MLATPINGIRLYFTEDMNIVQKDSHIYSNSETHCPYVMNALVSDII